MNVEALDRAIRAVDSQAKLARLLRERTGWELGQQSVSKWRKHGIPPRWVLHVEAVTGVSRHDLRPDLYPREDAA